MLYLEENTYINRYNGNVKIKEAVDGYGFGYGGTGLVKTKFDNVRIFSHYTELVKIYCDNGKFLLCRDDQLILTKKGTIKAQAIGINDEIICPKFLTVDEHYTYISFGTSKVVSKLIEAPQDIYTLTFYDTPNILVNDGFFVS